MKQEIRRALKSKNIILFGVQEEAVRFYEKYHESIHIKFFVTSYSENVTMQPMKEYGVETKLYDDIELTEDDLLILCDYSYYQPIERRLQTEGISEYKGYISSILAEGILEEKKIAVFMGSDFIKQLAEGLRMQPEIQKNCFCVYYPESELLKPYINRMAEYKHIARMSDFYIISVCDKNMYRAKVLPQEILPKECIRVSVSDYTFNGYYPQINNDRGTFSNFLYRERKRQEIPYNTLVLAREDKNLKKYVSENMPVEEIVNRVSDLDFYTGEQVRNHFKAALDNLKKSDKTADIPLAGVIENTFHDTVEYRNLDEWNVNMLTYVMKKVCEKIGMEWKEPDAEKLADHIEEISGSELPVYPSVLKHLNIKEYHNKKYKAVSLYRTRYLDFKEYIKFCAEYMYQIKELDEFLGIEEKTLW